MDISIEAIEADFAQAERASGSYLSNVYALRGLTRATLLAAGYGGPFIKHPFPVPEPPADDVSFTGLVDATETDDDDDVEDLFGDAPKR